MKNYNLKTMLMLALFTMMFGFTSEAQISEKPSTDGKVYEVEQSEAPRADRNEDSVKNKRKHKRMAKGKAQDKADKRMLKAMREVAEADGVVSPKEEAVIKARKEKINQRKMNRGKKAKKKKKGTTPDIKQK